MGTEYSYILCKTALSKSSLPGLNYSLNPYFGCEHGCKYCYSPSVFRGAVKISDWGRFVKLKKNIPAVLDSDLRKKPKGTIGLSTVTDPYQPVENWARLSRSCIEEISRTDFKLSIQTKSNLFLRDLEIMAIDKTDIGITITTLDENVAESLEPGASASDERIEALIEASIKGFETWIFFGPIIPQVNDGKDNIKKIVKIASKYNSRILYDRLNLRPGVMDSLSPALEEINTGLPARIRSTLKDCENYWDGISRFIENTCLKSGVRYESAF